MQSYENLRAGNEGVGYAVCMFVWVYVVNNTWLFVYVSINQYASTLHNLMVNFLSFLSLSLSPSLSLCCILGLILFFFAYPDGTLLSD